jgi:hypothetical protein
MIKACFPLWQFVQSSRYHGPPKLRCYKVVAVLATNKIASGGSSLNGCVTIGRSQLALSDMPRNKFELEAKW